MNHLQCILLFTILVQWAGSSLGFNIPVFSATLNPPTTITKTVEPSVVTITTTTTNAESVQLDSVVTTVAVTGATGRTGFLVVQELLNRNVPNVIAIVRDPNKATKLFPNPPSNLKIITCDLGDVNQTIQAINGCDAAIWCSTGFSDGNSPPPIPTPVTETVSAPSTNPITMLMDFFGLKPKEETVTIPKSQLPVEKKTPISIDVTALPEIAKYLVSTKNVDDNTNEDVILPLLPKLVMCSSAGVTRLGWDDEKKLKYSGAADIPIVRLNPFNILERKLESENKVRESGIDYCIVRPCGLNDDWPMNSRPIFTQGDVAVGRTNRQDLAKVLVDVLTTPTATGKTIEMCTIAGYPIGTESISVALARCKTDKEQLIPNDDVVEANYHIMQQLLPGEKQNSAALAMGQTYEQLDSGKVGRLGERGKENLANVRV